MLDWPKKPPQNWRICTDQKATKAKKRIYPKWVLEEFQVDSFATSELTGRTRIK
jgi:hypothetical protein